MENTIVAPPSTSQQEPALVVEGPPTVFQDVICADYGEQVFQTRLRKHRTELMQQFCTSWSTELASKDRRLCPDPNEGDHATTSSQP